MAIHGRTVGAPTVIMAAMFAIFVGSLVMAGPEIDQPGMSWPHEVDAGGATAWDRLSEIHESALAALATASPEDRPQIERVLRASFICAAYDGTVPPSDPPQEPLPAHSAGHQGAAQKIQAAYQALHNPPAPPEKPEEWANWSLCADNLEHGHDH